MTDEIRMPNNSPYEEKEHGMLGYPVVLYHIQLNTEDMKYIPWHWHDEVELDIVIKGSAVFKAGKNTTTLSAGQGQFVNQNVLHSISPIDENASCELFAIIFLPAFLFGYGSTVMSTKYLTPVVASKSLKHIVLNPDTDWQKHILDACHEIIKSHTAQEFGYELQVKEKLCSVWFDILKQLTSLESAENISVKVSDNLLTDSLRVKTAILYMQTHHHETVTLDDIASSVHISKSELCRCFKRTLNLSPFEYLMRFRIFEATRKMQRNEPVAQSISTLSFSVGFNNTSYFNKLFKQYLHCTPKEYKKKMLIRPDIINDDEMPLFPPPSHVIK